MAARTSTQRMHGIAEESQASTGATAAVQAKGKQQPSPPQQASPDQERVSPDPLRGTDRYRLVMPFHLRL